MKKKYAKAEIFRIIELWQESRISQKEFCKREKIGYHTFKYWHKKYKDEKHHYKENTIQGFNNEFIPVEMPVCLKPTSYMHDQIGVTFPNGVQLIWPSSIDIEKLKTLIGV
jgi:hypothetical protein